MYEYEDLTNYGKGKAILDKLEMVSGAPKTPEEISLDEAVAELEHQQKTNPNDTKEIERLKKDVHFYGKKVRKQREEFKKINELITRYRVLSRKIRLDGNVELSRMGARGIDYEYDIERLIEMSLDVLDKKMPQGLLMTESQKFSIMRQRVEKKIDKAIQNCEIKIVVTENDSPKRLEINDIYKYMGYKEAYDEMIDRHSRNFKQSPGVIELKNPYIYVEIGKLSNRGEIKNEYCHSLIPEISQIERLLKSNDISPNAYVKLEDAQRIYKEYAEKLIAYKIIEYFIPQLSGYQSKTVEKLKVIVEQAEKECDKLKSEADKIFNSTNLKEREIEPSTIEKEPEKVETKTNANEVSLDNQVVKDDVVIEQKDEVIEKEETKKTKLTENELKALSSGYRRGYIEERLKGSKLDYSEYLEREYPDQIELIEYIKEQEKKAKTLYEEYIKDRAKRISNDQPVVSFERFVKIKTGIKYEDANIELPIEIEEELKNMKAL